MNNSEDLYVGSSGDGTLNISDGGVISNTTGYIGSRSDAVGTVTVTGEESKWKNSDSLYVGKRGEGTIDISDGGVVTNTTGYIGYDNNYTTPGSVGTVTVTGQGSEWNNSSSSLVPPHSGSPSSFISVVEYFTLYVGYSGEGTLNIEAGGVVSNAGSYIGYSSGSAGTVTVTGDGSKWKNSDSLYVGRGGEGTLAIMAGGVVSNTQGRIGYSSGYAGTVTVIGEGSEWNNSSSLSVGDEGEAR